MHGRTPKDADVFLSSKNVCSSFEPENKGAGGLGQNNLCYWHYMAFNVNYTEK